MAHEAAARVILLDAHLGTGNARILRLDIQARCRSWGRNLLAQITDIDRYHLGSLLNSNRKATFSLMRRRAFVGGRNRACAHGKKQACGDRRRTDERSGKSF